MKTFGTLLLFVILSSYLHAQNNVGIGTNTPHAGAILELQSNNKALLLPRLSNTERDAIANPEQGMLIYNREINKFQGYVIAPQLPNDQVLLERTNLSGNFHTLCAGNYIQVGFAGSAIVNKIQLYLRNLSTTALPITISFGDGINIVQASSLVPVASETQVITLDLHSNFPVNASQSYFIKIEQASPLLEWAEEQTGSAATRNCTGVSFAYSYGFKIIQVQNNTLVYFNNNLNGGSYPVCSDGKMQINLASGADIAKMKLLLMNASNANQIVGFGISNGSNTLLGSGSITVPANSNAAWYEINFSTPIPVSANNSHFVVVTSHNQLVNWVTTTGSAFATICGQYSISIPFGLATCLYSSNVVSGAWQDLH